MTGICPQKPSGGSILPSNRLYRANYTLPISPNIGDLCPHCGQTLTINMEVLDKMGVIVPECFCGYQGVSNLPCDPVVYKKSCAPKGE